MRALGIRVGFPRQRGDRPKEASMSKVLKCGDLMPGCSFVAEGKDTAEVMAKGAEHAKTAHGMTSIPPDLAAKVQAAIRDK
jgi:predicted small metal-binding protein